MPSQPPARSETGPGERPRRSRAPNQLSRWSAWLIFAAIFLVIALVAARPLRRQIEAWRASTLVSQAAELARQQLYTDAITRYQTALSLAPDQIEALRGLADIYSLFEKPAAIPAWRALLTLPAHSEQDTLDFIGFTIRAQRFDLAEAELSRLLAGTNISIPTLTTAAEFFQRQGNTRQALAFAEQILRKEPDNSAHSIRVARFLLSMPEAEKQREGFQRLASVPALSPQDRLTLLQALETAPALATPETPSFLDQLPPLTPPSAADRIAQTDLRLRLAPDSASREAWITNTTDSLRQGSPKDQVALCRWLDRIREHARLLSLYSIAEATALPPILPTYLEALGQTKRWEDLQRAADQPLPVDPWILATFRAAAAAQLKQDSLAQEHWRRAMDSARRDPVRIQAMGDLALRLGSREKALEAFNFLANDDLHRAAGYRRLARLHEEARDTEQLRLLMREWAANAADDPGPNARYAYLSALVRRNLDDARNRMLPLVERFPARTAYRLTLAFIEWRQNQPQAALRRLERARIDPATSPQFRLVHALILDANGQTAAAREIARSVRPDSLLPEELELLARLNAK